MTDSNAADFSFLDLPDDELANHQPPAVKPALNTGTEEGKGEAAGNDDGGAAAAEEAAAAAAKAEQEAAAAQAAAAAQEAADAAKAAAKVDDKIPDTKPATAGKEPAAKAAEDAAAAAAKETKPADGTNPDAGAVDYKAAYERVMAPFKANGRDITPGSVDDVIQLMQMGANYNKKMAALKPNLALLKLLETNGLLSEEKIGYLIDLTKKDPGAISKLVKESGLDLLDLGGEKAVEYKPTAHKVDPRELELDAVLDEIQTTPSYGRTIEIIGKNWDGPSKQVIADQPQLIRMINQHVQAGIYDLVMGEVERERTFGRLQGLSDLQAYRQVGDAIHARGGFANLGGTQEHKPKVDEVVQPDPSKAAAEKAAKDKKLAASTPKAAAATATTEVNPLGLSDEEFVKLSRK